MLQGVAKCYAQKLGTKNVIAFFPSETQKKIIYVWHGSCSIYRYKKERMKMNQVLIVVNGKYKVYSETNGKRKLLGVFKTSQDAIRFMNS
jgi:hypothetical protein